MDTKGNEQISLAPRIGVVAGIIITLTMYIFFSWKNKNLDLDDALIYLRYVKNLVEGHGLVYNEGTSFNGLSSPLFSYLLAIAAWITGSVKVVSWALSAAFVFMASISMWAIFRLQLKHLAPQINEAFALTGAFIFLSIPYFHITYGMETGLFTLLSALLIYFSMTERFYIVGPLSSLLFLTRPEGIFLLAAIGIVYVYQNRSLPKFDWRTYLLPIAIVAANWSFNLFYYGYIMPETGMAKVWQGKSGLWGESWNFLNINYLLEWVFPDHHWLAYTMIAFSLIGAIALGASQLNLTVIVYLFFYTAFYLILNIPNYHWYYSPYFAFLPFYAAIGIGFSAKKTASVLPKNYQKFIPALAISMTLIPVAIFSNINLAERVGRSDYKSLGLYLSKHTPPKSVVAAVEIGSVGFYSDRYIVDILGLVNPYNAKFIGDRNFDEWTKHYKVDYIIAHKPIWNHELSVFSLGRKNGLREICDIAQPAVGLYQVLSDGSGIESCNGERWLPTEPVQAMPTIAASGYVESATAIGNFVRIQGWAKSGESVFESLGFVHSGLWRRFERPDVAEYFHDQKLVPSGFEMVISFDTPEQARMALTTSPCLAIRGANGTTSNLPLDAKKGCGPRVP